MRCKAGDRAVVVRTGPATANLMGRVTRLIAPAESTKGYAAWLFEGSPWRAVTGDEVLVLEDICLKPIRDPGEDVQDETLSWKRVPLTDKEVA